MYDPYESYRKMHINMGIWVIGLIIAAYAIIDIVFKKIGTEMEVISISSTGVFCVAILVGAVYLAAYKVCASKKVPSWIKNISIIFLTEAVCGGFAFAEYHYAAMLSAIVIPLFVSAGFGEKLYLNISSGISFAILVIISTISFINNDEYSLLTIESCLIMIPMIVIVRVVCESIRKFCYTNVNSIQSNQTIKEGLEGQLLRDGMTGLYNHASFYGFLKQLTSGNNKEIESVSLAVVDIDNFKSVNDTYGHSKGDEVILYLCETLKRYCDDGNYVCRYGGEEFAVIFINHKANEAKEKMKLVLQDFSSHTYEWKKEPVTFSCGICEYMPGRMSDKELFGIADKVLYRAKSNGKNQVMI